MKNLIFALAVALCPRMALCLSIGVSADAAGTDCNLVIPVPGAAVAYVVASIDGGTPNGVEGASFRIGGLPTGWTAAVLTVDPAASLLVGDPFGDGVAMAYPGSVTGNRVLFTLLIQSASPVSSGTLVILPHASASAQSCGFEGVGCPQVCPRFCSSNGFGLDCLCAEPRTATINGNPCLVATQEADWTRIKNLYR